MSNTCMETVQYGEGVDQWFSAKLNSRSLYAIARPSVCLSSVTFVRAIQRVEIFSNISMPFVTLVIR